MRNRSFILIVALIFALNGSLPVLQAFADEAEGSSAPDTLYANPDPYGDEDDDDERSIAPWVIGGVLIGGGAAAAIALSNDDDDDDDDDAAAAPPADADDDDDDDDTCDEGDATGTWTAETPENNTTRWTMTLSAGGTGQFQSVDEVDGDPDAAMIRVSGGSWSLADCTLTVNSDTGLIDGSGEISGNHVSIDGKSFSK